MVGTVPGADVDPASLGVFDYAHLRAPLPKGIVSGIFKSSPGSYFLMRRSNDGFVSATGMFKATFPYATVEEEETERRYIKSLSTTSHEETAGNVWIPPEEALKLADEYRIIPWIHALLDPSDISASTGTDSTSTKHISAPPKFQIAPPTPSSLPRSGRGGRSMSPSKAGSKRAIASPKKRSTKISATQSEVSAIINGAATPAESTVSSTAPAVETVEKEAPVVFAPVEEDAKVKIHVDQDTKTDKSGKPVTTTKVEVELPLPPSSAPPTGEEVVRMVEEAKEMVKAAAGTVSATSAASAKGKRKAKEVEESTALVRPQLKRQKTDVELRKERMKKRALIGISATVAIGYAISSPHTNWCHLAFSTY
jgi:hypothetical protein